MSVIATLQNKVPCLMSPRTSFIIMTFLLGGFFLIEVVVGYITNSMALIADSFHMLSDVASLIVGYLALRFSALQSSRDMYTYGYARAEVLGALVNAVFLVALCFSIFIESMKRLVILEGIENPVLVFFVGLAGLIINIFGMFLFHQTGHGHSHGGLSHGHSHGDGGGGHGHSHGGGEHSHSHGGSGKDHSHSHASSGHSHSHGCSGHSHSHGDKGGDGHGHSYVDKGDGHGHSHGDKGGDDHGHSHGDKGGDGHGHSHGDKGGDGHGHSHGDKGGDNHGHSHGDKGDGHGHSHGDKGDGHGHSHGDKGDGHGHSHGDKGDDHGHSHGDKGGDGHGHSHGDKGGDGHSHGKSTDEDKKDDQGMKGDVEVEVGDGSKDFIGELEYPDKYSDAHPSLDSTLEGIKIGKPGGATLDDVSDIEQEKSFYEDEKANLLTKDGQSKNVADPPAGGKKNGTKSGKSAGQLNIEGVYLHILGDALGSIIVMISALFLIYGRGTWTLYVDPSMSIIMVMIILKTSIPLLMETAKILMNSAPQHIQINDLRERLLSTIPEIKNVHELHVWQLAGDKIIASVHVKFESPEDYDETAAKIKDFFHDEGIHSTTVQIEFSRDDTEGMRGQCMVVCSLDSACDDMMCCKPENE